MSSEQDFPQVLEKTFNIERHRCEPPVALSDDDAFDISTRKLTFAMLGCETKDPYGPLRHTAQLLIDMIGMAAIHANQRCDDDSANTKSCIYRKIFIRMHIYNAQTMEYPQDDNCWDLYHGIIVPGSFSAAYDTDPWIQQLKDVIQTKIVPNCRKTLGICFGHQVFAHSFSTTTKPITTTNASEYTNDNTFGGKAVATPSGPRAGRFCMPLTDAGTSLLLSDSILPNLKSHESSIGKDTKNDNNSVHLYFTHGDMVEQIPNVAVILGGDSTVPIQSVAYFATSQDADQYRSHLVGTNPESLPPLPYAVTLQAHPEYSTSIELGVHRTLFQCMDAMERRRPDSDIRSRDDVIQNFQHVQNDSIAVVAKIGRIFNWF